MAMEIRETKTLVHSQEAALQRYKKDPGSAAILRKTGSADVKEILDTSV